MMLDFPLDKYVYVLSESVAYLTIKNLWPIVELVMCCWYLRWEVRQNRKPRLHILRSRRATQNILQLVVHMYKCEWDNNRKFEQVKQRTMVKRQFMLMIHNSVINNTFHNASVGIQTLFHETWKKSSLCFHIPAFSIVLLTSGCFWFKSIQTWVWCLMSGCGESVN